MKKSMLSFLLIGIACLSLCLISSPLQAKPVDVKKTPAMKSMCLAIYRNNTYEIINQVNLGFNVNQEVNCFAFVENIPRELISKRQNFHGRDYLLNLALYDENYPLFQFLLDKGANINNGLLFLAVRDGKVNAVEHLLKHGANPNLSLTSNYPLPLIQAIQQDRFFQVSSDSKDTPGFSIPGRDSRKERYAKYRRTIELLLQYKANPNVIILDTENYFRNGKCYLHGMDLEGVIMVFFPIELLKQNIICTYEDKIDNPMTYFKRKYPSGFTAADLAIGLEQSDIHNLLKKYGGKCVKDLKKSTSPAKLIYYPAKQ